MTATHTTRITDFGRVYLLALFAILFGLMSLARADAWFDAGDSALRHDLQLLVDSGVIDVPVTAWPIPSADVAWAIENTSPTEKLSAGERAALQRMKGRLAAFTRKAVHATAHVSGAAKPIVLRTFENTPREEGEVGATLSGATEHFSGRAAVQWVVDPDDEKELRFDGSYGSVRLGNWLLSATALDRWWGPGWDNSLILSNSARPIPSISLDRESSQPFESKWLNWIGPWRLTTFMGRMEEEREDIDHPLMFGMRIVARPFANVRFGSVRPFNGLEVAIERTAQWCGEGLPCDLDAFWNMFTGNDNADENVDPEDEPGNQLGGWNIRWTSPIGSAPYAIYLQRTGESFSLEAPPRQRRSFDLFGVEIWGERESGSSWRVHAEFAGTTCSDLDQQLEPIFDCAYNNGIFNVEGYRYRGRPIGASMDGDGRSYTLGLQIVTAPAASGSVLVRFAELNRGGVVPDTRNTVATGPVDLWNLETSASVPTKFGDFKVGLGFDYATDQLTDRLERSVRGFAELRYQF